MSEQLDKLRAAIAAAEARAPNPPPPNILQRTPKPDLDALRAKIARAEGDGGGRLREAARLLRGDSLSKIEKAMRLGFDTFRCNVNWQIAIQKKCHMAALHALHTHLNDDVPELRKKIVHLALFR